MKDFTKIETVITMDDVKNAAPCVYDIIVKSNKHILNAFNIFGFSSTKKTIADIINDMPLEVDGYSEDMLDDEKFHIMIIKYFYTVKMMQSYEVTLFDIISMSKVAKVIVSDEANESISIDAELIKAFNIDLMALPASYRVRVNSDVIIIKCSEIMYNYIVDKFPDGPSSVRYKDFKSYKDFKRYVSVMANEIKAEFDEIGYTVVNSDLFVHVFMSHLYSSELELGINICDNIGKDAKRYIEAIECYHDIMFRHHSGENVSTKELINNLIKVTLLLKNIENKSVSVYEVDKEEDDGSI